MIFSKNTFLQKKHQEKTASQQKKREFADGSAAVRAAITPNPSEPKKMTKPAIPKFNTPTKRASAPSFNASRFTASATPSSESRKLTVGKDISLSGEIAACDHLVVEGTVEATIKGGQSLEVTDTGLFKGKVEIDNAIIAGCFEGNLIVKSHLLIRNTGSVTGDIRYGDLTVESGASLNGTIKCVGLPEDVQSEKDKKVGSVKPVFKTTVANEDDMLHEEVTIAPPVTASML